MLSLIIPPLESPRLPLEVGVPEEVFSDTSAGSETRLRNKASGLGWASPETGAEERARYWAGVEQMLGDSGAPAAAPSRTSRASWTRATQGILMGGLGGTGMHNANAAVLGMGGGGTAVTGAGSSPGPRGLRLAALLSLLII